MSLFYNDKEIALKARIVELQRDNQRLLEANTYLLKTQAEMQNQLSGSAKVSSSEWHRRCIAARKRIRKLESQRAEMVEKLAKANARRSTAAYMHDLVVDIENAAKAAAARRFA